MDAAHQTLRDDTTLPEAVGWRASSRSQSAAQLYVDFSPLLAGIATGRFGLPADDAENAVHEAFISYLRTPATIHDPKSWLVGAICNICREHWRRGVQRQHAVDPTCEQDVEKRILSTQVLARLPASSQNVLRLHYIEGLTAAEIAARLKTSERYAEQLIHRGLRRARGLVRT